MNCWIYSGITVDT